MQVGTWPIFVTKPIHKDRPVKKSSPIAQQEADGAPGSTGHHRRRNNLQLGFISHEAHLPRATQVPFQLDTSTSVLRPQGLRCGESTECPIVNSCNVTGHPAGLLVRFTHSLGEWLFLRLRNRRCFPQLRSSVDAETKKGSLLAAANHLVPICVPRASDDFVRRSQCVTVLLYFNIAVSLTW
jgi:hypothetical protein